MPQEDGMSQDGKAYKVWGLVPTCFWLDKIEELDDFVLRVIQRPIDRDIQYEMTRSSGSVKFGGIVLCIHQASPTKKTGTCAYTFVET